MAINSQLLRFKSPGTKILTQITENIPQAEAPNGARILVINSRKGEVNKLVLVNDWNHYKSMFDDINDADERRGNFSAISAFYMLEVSPIYVINLRQFDDRLDKAGFQELSTKLDVKNGMGKEKPYSKLFNTSQLWKIDPEELISNQNLDKLLVFGNIGNSNVSLFVRKTRTNQSTLTLDSWYKNLNRQIPAYVNPDDKVSDWMVDVYIFNNTFNSNSSSHPRYGFCFDNEGKVRKEVVTQTGTKADGLDQLSNIVESGFVGIVTGSLIQGFTSDSGNDLDIITTLNSLVSQTGIIASRNDSLFDPAATWYEDDSPNSNGMKKPIPVDMKGHTLCNITEVGTFDYDGVITGVKSMSYEYEVTKGYLPELIIDEITSEPKPDKSTEMKTVMGLEANLIGYETSSSKLLPESKSKIIIFGDERKPNLGAGFAGYDGNLATVKSINRISTQFTIYGANTSNLAIQPVGDFPNFVDGSTDFKYDMGKLFPMDSTGTYFVYPNNHPLKGKPLAFNEESNLDGKWVGKNVIHDPQIGDNFYLDPKSNYSVQDLKNFIQDLIDDSKYHVTDTPKTIFVTDIKLDEIKKLSDKSIYTNLVENYSTPNNIYEVSFDKDLAFVQNKDQSLSLDFGELDPQTVIDLDNGSSMLIYPGKLHCFRILSAEDSSKSYNGINLNAYKMRNAQFLDGTRERQNEVLDVLLTKSIRNGLQNRDLVRWNYIVDGFKTYIEPNVKNQIKVIAEDRIIGRAIYSMPSIKDFAKSTNPYFSQEIGGDFEVKYIPLGGNLELPYNNSFSLPSNNGWYAYGFGPNLTISGTTKTLPPAPIISNLFQMKHLDGKPYKILAGSDGIIRFTGISGVEHVFNETNDGQGDRDYLDPFGYNVIVNKPNGIQIYGNKTSNNVVSTPASSIHTSEVLMFIQERINRMLEKFVFKLNNNQNRLIVKEQADQICEEPKGEGAIYDYVNIMDATNNTAELIANRYGILDTIIYDQNGMEILVHRTKLDSITNAASFEVVSR